MDNMNFRGAVYSKYQTIGDFAKATGWPRSKASRIINGVQDMSMDDIHDAVRALDVRTSESFMLLFFPSLSTKWTGDAKEVTA